MKQYLIKHGYIPLDKSWIIRMGFLDLVNGHADSIQYLQQQNQADLSDDLKALYQASLAWKAGEKRISAGESGTLYRFLRFYAWLKNLDKEFVLEGTLKERMKRGKICNDSSIIKWSPLELITLDDGTSQWASASYLLGVTNKIENPKFKLQVTYDAKAHWEEKRAHGERWEPRLDETILNQALAYLQWLKEGKMNFTPQQAEDYCFARVFGIMTKEEGEAKWPSLRGHESDRISELEQELQKDEVTSKDHRIIQAIAMLKGGKVNISNPDSVNKSWPQFWRFLEYATHS